MTQKSQSPDPSWCVYIVRCKDESLYTGITNNLDRRVREHNGEIGQGARYTRPRRPVKLVYSEPAPDRKVACKREFQLKALKKAEKESLIRSLDLQNTNIKYV